MSIVTDQPNPLTLPELTRSHHVLPPNGHREPLKVSIYERMAKSNAQLMPIFPYDEAGTIVPCGAVLYGGESKVHGHFFHWNTVSEIGISWGAQDAMLATGSIMATQPFHGVNSFLRDEKDPNAFVVATITQRQSSESGQREALSAKCESCKQDLVKVEYAAAPLGAPDYDPTAFGGAATDVVHQFSTMWGGKRFVEQRNSDEFRICSNCGHENSFFDNSPWGWSRLVDQTSAINAARLALIASAKEVAG